MLYFAISLDYQPFSTFFTLLFGSYCYKILYSSIKFKNTNTNTNNMKTTNTQTTTSYILNLMNEVSTGRMVYHREEVQDLILNTIDTYNKLIENEIKAEQGYSKEMVIQIMQILMNRTKDNLIDNLNLEIRKDDIDVVNPEFSLLHNEIVLDDYEIQMDFNINELVEEYIDEQIIVDIDIEYEFNDIINSIKNK